jgi:hypothetical protein
MMSNAFVAATRRECGGKAAMRGFAGYLLIGGLAGLAMGLVAADGLGLAVGARPVAEPGQVIQHVDRTHKGDRLHLQTTFGRGRLQPAPKQPSVLLEGCEPPISSLAAAGRSDDSGRCLAEIPSKARTMAG